MIRRYLLYCNPDLASTHKILMAGAHRFQNDPRIPVLSANYHTNWQLSLDRNVAGDLSNEFRENMRRSGRHLAEVLHDLL